MDFVIHWNETAMGLHVFPIPIPTPTSLSTRSLWVFPVPQVQALVSFIEPGLVICFTLDNIHVSMLFSWNIPPSPSPTESKRLFSLFSFTFIKRLFSSSLLSAIRMVSSAYQRLLAFLLAVLIPDCASSSLTFLMMYSSYRLNNQGENI